jgi:hypothetical protein
LTWGQEYRTSDLSLQVQAGSIDPLEEGRVLALQDLISGENELVGLTIHTTAGQSLIGRQVCL